ncbi:hypothetical protein DMUE_1173 [Dictyocoela muelleri]|nr:hypothetical protein DMUE_1173 [Dictyocoela muelleri]
MEKKSKATYLKVFQWIKEKCNHEPKYYIADFEVSVIKAFKMCFPSTILNSCNFHFCQIIYRFLISNGHMKRFKEDAEFKKLIKHLLFLAYVSVSNVTLEFEKIEKLAEKVVGFSEILRIFKKNFIENSYNLLTKEIQYWSIHERILKDLPTTTNSLEAYHRHLNSKVERKKPNLKKAMLLIKKEEKRISIKINSIMRGNILPNKRKNNNLKVIVNNYNFYNGDEFLRIISEHIKVHINK